MSGAPSVLFDAPGPQARLRHRIMTVIAGLVLLGLILLIIRGLANPDNNQLTAEKWQPFLTSEAWLYYYLPGIGATLLAAAVAVVLALILGLLLGMGRLSELTPLRWFCSVFVEFFRAVPVLMMMLFAYFGLQQVGLFGPTLIFISVVIGLTFYNASVIAELVRAGVGSLPSGQREAGLAIGMTPNQTLAIVLLPQAITAMLPSMISQLVVILKDSALGYWINYLELLNQAKSFGTYQANTIPALIVAAVIYIVLNYGLSRLASLVESRLKTRSKGGAPLSADTVTGPDAAVGVNTAAF
ncbi:MAG TPA: amino acid ABC transporter permease [Propionibacteriaceae bacterium]|nr:amino acid ABC transporter permease [Propionibacteriaceae bacterium]